MDTVMRRRAFLSTVGALSALAVCPGCSGSKGAPKPSIAPIAARSYTPAPSPPNAAAAPSSFSAQPLWPDFGRIDVITAVREHYLCASADVSEETEAAWTVSSGSCPVVADLEGPTTWAVLPDGDGAWTTRAITAADFSTASADPASSSTPGIPMYQLVTGPALLDETYAYLAVGLISGERLSSSDAVCPVDLVKVDLSDGTIAASTRVSNAFVINRIEHGISMSFTEDRSALLISGDSTSKDESTPEAIGIGLRLSATDLSVQFDATTVLTEPSSYRRQCGEALAAGRGNNNVIVYLADGTIEPLADTTDMLVRDGWIYYHDRTDHADHARNLRTGETITISDTGGYIDYLDDRTENRVQTDQHEVILGSGKMGSSASFSVRRPGEAEPLLSWKTEERKIPEAACVFGNVLYTTGQMDPDGKVQLTSLPSGDDLGEIPDIGKDSYESFAVQSFAVSAWGLASGGSFYPAFKWFDS